METRIFHIRKATVMDAERLSQLRLIVDGETDNFDRERGGDFLSTADFEEMIRSESVEKNSIFLVAEVKGHLVGFLRGKGGKLKRTSHRLEFGVAVKKQYWGQSIGKSLIQEMLQWADQKGIRKVTLQVLETNKKAIALYERLGFIVEGELKDDKKIGDIYYSTILMGRRNESNG
ncbi:GNAT family N-acetyltransferase [Cytobacillus kochii]|uniref:GNAT family N-acetyltransferase n=1 Tax=Cytobacillus kochii TaxID=859143 RepID=UPI00278820EE|nr:GNAT family N-acetyltransferase [Cytobacillus kochii]MDQ0185386.1 RimJ/RimL family protein N-acetyltransferase [Cytobacillus kochii]